MLSKELLEKTVAEAIDITRNQYAKTDSVYKMELEKLEKLLREYEDLPLGKTGWQICRSFLYCGNPGCMFLGGKNWTDKYRF